jgi:exodeoxyribonuclease V alpha subunit
MTPLLGCRQAIAMKLGIEKTAMIRVRAGISYALTEALDDGHCGLPTDELMPLAEKLLEVPLELVRTALDLELADGAVVTDSVGEAPCTFLAGPHRAERAIAERLMRLANGALPWSWIDPDKALPWVTDRLQLTFAESQIAAIRLALAKPTFRRNSYTASRHPADACGKMRGARR